MAQKDENSPSNLWTRRSNTSKLNQKPEHSSGKDSHDSPSIKRYGNSNGRNPFNTVNQISTSTTSSPTTTGAASAFGLGSGAFSSFGSVARTPKTPGTAFDFGKVGVEKKEPVPSEKEDKGKENSTVRSLKPQPSLQGSSTDPYKLDYNTPWPLKYSWVLHYRPPTSKNQDYEKSIHPMFKISTAQQFWTVYEKVQRPSKLPTVSDYHLFKEGIRPVWEDEENKRGGKWIMRLKKGVADRYWENLLLALIGDQFFDAGEEICGVVVSVRSGEDVFSIWTKKDGGRNIRIRETLKEKLELPADTIIQWKSHDDSITQRQAVDQARQEKTQQLQHDKRRSTVGQSADKEKREDSIQA